VPRRAASAVPPALANLPLWALEVMASCARGSGASALAAQVEAARTERFFEDAQEEAWYARFPQAVRSPSRDLTAPESWQPVSPESIDAVFGEGGALARIFDRYEPRAGQAAMAHQAADALNARCHLLAEAGTGVGKSLAYLVPCALWSLKNALPIVISTNTRNLQSQLIQKDVPLVRRVLDEVLPGGAALKAVVLKGRNNYLCLKRFGAFVEGGFESLNEADALLFAELTAWAAATEDGDLDAFRPAHASGDMGLLRYLGCKAEECTGKRCRFHNRCFLQRARQAAQGAHLVIVNHALVFAELQNPGSLLPPHAQVVFDEAHNLEAAATSSFSEELSPAGLYELCQRLAPSRGREAGSLLYQARTGFVDAEGAALSAAERAEAIALLADLRACGVALAKAGKALFETLGRFFERTPETTLRYRSVPDGERPPAAGAPAPLRREICYTRSVFVPAGDAVPEADLAACRDAVAQELTRGVQLLKRLEASIEAKASAAPPAGQSAFEDVQTAASKVREGLEGFGAALDLLLRGDDGERVYWLARLPGKERAAALCASPLDISAPMANLLYAAKESVLFSSATLRIRNDFEHIRRRLGLTLVKDREVRDFVAESPFDYPGQCCVAVADFLPELERGQDYALELSRLMYCLFTEANGRSLALFTSYEMLQSCAERLRPHLAAKGIDLLVQSSTLGRDAMTARFRAQERPTVLFGTQSFWEGVDVVGDALSCLVIARLPFENCGDPLFQARCEKIEAAGGSSFAELALPQAIIRFRQGFGRLIRSRQDRGVVVVADGRILRKSYGTVFARALPVRIEAMASRRALLARVKGLFAR